MMKKLLAAAALAMLTVSFAFAQTPVNLPVPLPTVYAAWNAAWLDRNPGKAPPFVAPEDGRIYFIGIESAAELMAKGCKRVPGEQGAAAMTEAARLINAEYARKRYLTRVTPEENGKESLFLLNAQLAAGCPGAPAGGADTKAAYDKGFAEGLAAALKAVQGVTKPQ